MVVTIIFRRKHARFERLRGFVFLQAKKKATQNIFSQMPGGVGTIGAFCYAKCTHGTFGTIVTAIDR